MVEEFDATVSFAARDILFCSEKRHIVQVLVRPPSLERFDSEEAEALYKLLRAVLQELAFLAERLAIR